MERLALNSGRVQALKDKSRGNCSVRHPQFLFAATVFAIFICVHPAVPAETTSYSRASYVFPPDVVQSGVSFAGIRIPLDRQEVSSRIFEQINYLLMDRRAGMMEWFDRMAISGPFIRKVLSDENIPPDLIYLPVLLSDLLPNARTSQEE